MTRNSLGSGRTTCEIDSRTCSSQDHRPLTWDLHCDTCTDRGTWPSCRRRDESGDTPRVACEPGNRVVSILVSLI
ncbi:hypothetical protein Scep_004027 [Stephania cephalantha]|uniref:Uncharacterized protein n=1 Tax=Stephania cephalantha TaxID=152367 RepID=A0AAP0KRN1_9MAGN